jgi:uncharacterized protein YodC (DUF2158 family)
MVSQMSHQFSIGDTVKIKRSGLEVEVTELHPTDPSRVVCSWFDDGQLWWEVLFNVGDLELVRAKEQPTEILDKPIAKPRKRKAVESE